MPESNELFFDEVTIGNYAISRMMNGKFWIVKNDEKVLKRFNNFEDAFRFTLEKIKVKYLPQ